MSYLLKSYIQNEQTKTDYGNLSINSLKNQINSLSKSKISILSKELSGMTSYREENNIYNNDAEIEDLLKENKRLWEEKINNFSKNQKCKGIQWNKLMEEFYRSYKKQLLKNNNRANRITMGLEPTKSALSWDLASIMRAAKDFKKISPEGDSPETRYISLQQLENVLLILKTNFSF